MVKWFIQTMKHLNFLYAKIYCTNLQLQILWKLTQKFPSLCAESGTVHFASSHSLPSKTWYSHDYIPCSNRQWIPSVLYRNREQISINMTTEKCLQMAQRCAEFKDKLLNHTTELTEEKWCMFYSLTHPLPFHNSPPEWWFIWNLVEQNIKTLINPSF